MNVYIVSQVAYWTVGSYDLGIRYSLIDDISDVDAVVRKCEGKYEDKTRSSPSSLTFIKCGGFFSHVCPLLKHVL